VSERLAGKVALVTGAAGGIGRAIAQALVADGTSVALADVSGDQDRVADELGETAWGIQCNVSAEADVQRMVDATVEHFGRLDILCNNAGVDGELVPTLAMTSENFDQVVAVSLRSVFLGHRYGIPAILASGGGAVINMASIAGLVGVAGGSAYCAAKAGVLALTRVAAIEYAQSGVRVNAICPGIIETPMIAALGAEHPIPKAYTAATPAGRLGQPEEIAGLVRYLASDEAKYLTGAALPVDGGYTAL
jgi:NAD(P)-dependent dehydrogenase (short-subunit alcohol dehydrogenase family)